MSEYAVKIKIETEQDFVTEAEKINNKLDKMDEKFSRFGNNTAKIDKNVARLSKGLSRLALVVLPSVALGLRNVVTEGVKFEHAIADLSALTGIEGKGLKSLSDQSENLSLQFGRTADSIAVGMKRIASNRSQLIGVAGAIEEVAEKATILSVATGMPLLRSSDVLTATMNQFNLAHKDVDRVMNAFAQGAKLGAFEVDRAAQAFSRSGAALRLAGFSFEQAMAAVQVGSQLNLTPEMVGTQMKTMILRLSSQDNVFNPQLMGVNRALENIKRANLTTRQATALFGMESFQVGMALIENLDLFKRWTKEVTGTNKAYDQANTMMMTMGFRFSLLKTRLQDIKREWFFSEGVYKTLSRIVDIMDHFLKQDTIMARFNWELIKLTAGLTAFTLTVFGLVKLTGAIGIVTGALFGAKGLFTLLAATKIGTFFVGIGATLKAVVGTIAAGMGMSAVALGASLAFIGVSLIAGISGIILSFIETWDLLFNADTIGGAISIFFRSIGFGITKGMGMVLKIVEPLIDKIGGIFKKDWEKGNLADRFNQWAVDGYFTPEEQAQFTSKTRDLKASLETSFIADQGIAKQVEDGTLKVEFSVDANGALIPKAVEVPKNVRVLNSGGTGFNFGSGMYPVYQAPAFVGG